MVYPKIMYKIMTVFGFFLYNLVIFVWIQHAYLEKIIFFALDSSSIVIKWCTYKIPLYISWLNCFKALF